jgi:RND family efflux transporter MFP subunit
MKKLTPLCSFFSILLLITTTNTLAKDKPITVNVKPLSELLISSILSAPANIIGLNHSTISAEITGRALSINFETGDNVKKGQKLVSIDCRSYSLARKQANAALKVAQTQLNYSKKQLIRNQNLVKKGIIPRDAFEKIEANQLIARADISLKKASIETADLAINRCQISAPFAGQITRRLVQQGQLVTAGTPLFLLMQTNNVEVKAALSPNNVLKLTKSPTLEFVAGDTKIKATLRSVIQTIDETTRTQEVRLSLPKNTQIATGLSGRVEWNDQTPQLPAEYVIRRGTQLGIMLADDIVESIGKAKFHLLLKAQEGQPNTVNLPKNTSIITLNRYRVKDGDAIKIQ